MVQCMDGPHWGVTNWGCIPLGIGMPTGLGGELSLGGVCASQGRDKRMYSGFGRRNVPATLCYGCAVVRRRQ